MRAKVSLKGRGLIPFNYNLALAGAVYGPIKRVNSDLASRIHSSTEFKYFTFSLIQIPERRISPEGIYVENECYFLMSSPRAEIVHCFVEGILESPTVRVGTVTFDVESVEILKNPEFNGRSVFSTVSPIIVRSVREENGRLKIVDLYPTEPKFYENLRKNLVKKFKRLYKEEKDDISFSKPFSTKMMRIQIKDTFHRASLMVFEAWGDSGLLRLGYETGFGEKNSMGFGMVKLAGRNSRRMM
ncbi:MAG: CRISPR-associated endoribonuclease Cas6 [Theionarchaea archaeon]|nr:CRISPR-associated endoribonuclease Cas6 [Theionarchaea archaeon]